MILRSWGWYTSLMVVHSDGNEQIAFLQYLHAAAGVDSTWYCTRSGVGASRYEIIDVIISGGTRLTGASEFLSVRSDERRPLVRFMNQSIYGYVNKDTLDSQTIKNWITSATSKSPHFSEFDSKSRVRRESSRSDSRKNVEIRCSTVNRWSGIVMEQGCCGVGA